MTPRGFEKSNFYDRESHSWLVLKTVHINWPAEPRPEQRDSQQLCTHKREKARKRIISAAYPEPFPAIGHTRCHSHRDDGLGQPQTQEFKVSVLRKPSVISPMAEHSPEAPSHSEAGMILFRINRIEWPVMCNNIENIRNDIWNPKDWD